MAVARLLAHVRADILVLQGIDYDLAGHGLGALIDLIEQEGMKYPYYFMRHPNSGMATPFDLDGDGRKRGARDAQGFGLFAGNRGMAVLSRWPVDAENAKDLSGTLWKDVPDAPLPVFPDGQPFPSMGAQSLQRLSSVAYWHVPIALPSGERLHALAFHATPPVFDGDEDRNGLRNAAEIGFWQSYLDGTFGAAPQGKFFIAGIANTDPDREGDENNAIRALLSDPRLQDPLPESPDHGRHTVDWPEPSPGDMRASYILPSSDLKVIASGVFWPSDGSPEETLLEHKRVPASRHRVVWVDVSLN